MPQNNLPDGFVFDPEIMTNERTKTCNTCFANGIRPTIRYTKGRKNCVICAIKHNANYYNKTRKIPGVKADE